MASDPGFRDLVLFWEDEARFRHALDELRARGATIVAVDAARYRATIRVPEAGLASLGPLLTDLDIAGAHLA